MPEAQKLVFHIGLEKTGTSSLQACLHRNHAILKRHSVLYPRRNLAYGWMNHKPLVGCYAIDDVGDKWLKVDPSRRDAMVGSLVDEIAAAPERTAVISAEHFSSRFRAVQIGELQGDFARFDCRIVIVLRDHLSRLFSSYDTYVTNGGALPLDVFADGMMRPEALDLRYADLIEPWERVFGRDRVELAAYGPDIIKQVLARLAPGLADEPGLRTFRHKVSARADVVAALRLANAAAAPALQGSDAAWARGTQRRLQLKAWLHHAAQGRPATAFSLDDDLMARLDEIAAGDRARLEDRYGFVLPPRAGAAGPGGIDDEAADLLARALVARAAKPWTIGSLRGAGLAVGLAARDDLFQARRWIANRRQRRAATAKLDRGPT